MSQRSTPPRPTPGFATTRWSLVVSLREGDDVRSREALEELCRIYWAPVRAYVRRFTGREQDADDLTQGLFADLIERGDLGGARSERGRFRAWLLGCAKHWLLARRREDQAEKRGGGRAPLSLDDPRVEGLTPAAEAEAERRFEEDWALALLADVQERLRREEIVAGRVEAYELLRPRLGGGASSEGTYAELAARLGTTEGALRVATHRLRRRFGELLREAVGDTVADEDAVEEELARLRAALARG